MQTKGIVQWQSDQPQRGYIVCSFVLRCKWLCLLVVQAFKAGFDLFYKFITTRRIIVFYASFGLHTAQCTISLRKGFHSFASPAYYRSASCSQCIEHVCRSAAAAAAVARRYEAVCFVDGLQQQVLWLSDESCWWDCFTATNKERVLWRSSYTGLSVGRGIV
jgi:hypothetical protein